MTNAEQTQHTKHGAIRIGISGWTYAPWRGVFFPPKLPHRTELAFAAETFPSIEINGTFYSLQRPSSFGRWAAETPEDFVFAVKGPRYITHMRRLRDVESPLANFFASGILRLGKKLGPILWQFPPNFKFDADLLERFFLLLPRDTHAAAEMARLHDAKLKWPDTLESGQKRPLRYAMEIRHESFMNEDFVALLRRHRIALCCADTVDWPRLMDVTSDFVYCRLHGSEELYASGYGPAAIEQWAELVASWARGCEPAGVKRASSKAPPRRATRDVYVYFDNDIKVRAPFDAQALMRRVDQLLKTPPR